MDFPDKVPLRRSEEVMHALSDDDRKRVLLVGLVIDSLATTVVLRFVVALIHTGSSGRSLWRNVAFMLFVSLVTVAVNVIQIALWATAFS